MRVLPIGARSDGDTNSMMWKERERGTELGYPLSPGFEAQGVYMYTSHELQHNQTTEMGARARVIPEIAKIPLSAPI